MSVLIARGASDGEILDVVHRWIDALAREEYESVADALGYARAFGRPKQECIREAIQGYRSATYYPGIERFIVTDWRTARGGNQNRAQEVVRYKPNSTGLVGAVAFDLPLNGSWSTLTADFVFFEGSDPMQGFPLSLEDTGSNEA
jgi:hypothetical protein